MQNRTQEQNALRQHNEQGMFKAGMEILEENQRRKNWEETQLDVKAIEPESMQLRKQLDERLRKDLKNTGDNFSLPKAYIETYTLQAKLLQEQSHEALLNNDKQSFQSLKQRIIFLAETVKVAKSKLEEFVEDHFRGKKSRLSKGVSQQQISFATQMYCQNPNLMITYASPADILLGQRDYYGNLVKVDQQYAIVRDFYDNPVLINVFDGNKDCFLLDIIKCTEYMNFVNEISKEAKKAAESKTALKIPFERINYKMDTMFGYNDGTATPEQDQLVLMFAHDDGVLQDANTFKRHLYEHPNIQNLNYGGFNFETLEYISDLGPGDKNYWHDNIDDFDRLKLVDAICNQDNPNFNMSLLRTLVKEYYIRIVETAWWKGMGFNEGRLEIIRLKQKELIKQRFKIKKAEAAQLGMKEFLFDGKVYPSGVDLKKQKKEKEKILKQNQNTTNTTGLGSNLLNNNPIK